MIKTPNLDLPIYDKPDTDTFKVADWNKANENIDYVFGEFKNNPNVNAIDIKAREDIINNHREVTEQLEENTNIDINEEIFISHRGLSSYAPENSLPAFEMSCKLGFWGVECDIQTTLDNELIICHDDTVDRTTNGTGRVDSLTLEQCRNFTIDSGSNVSIFNNLKMPTFEEYLQVLSKYSSVPVVELKGTATNITASKVLTLLKKYGYDGINKKACVISTNANLLRLFPTVMLTGLVKFTCNKSDIDLAKSISRNCFVDVDLNALTDDYINYANEKSVAISAFTIGNYSSYLTCKNKNIKIITTDYICTSKNKLLDEKSTTTLTFKNKSDVAPYTSTSFKYETDINNATIGWGFDSVGTLHIKADASIDSRIRIKKSTIKTGDLIEFSCECTNISGKDPIFYTYVGTTRIGEINSTLGKKRVYSCCVAPCDGELDFYLGTRNGFVGEFILSDIKLNIISNTIMKEGTIKIGQTRKAMVRKIAGVWEQRLDYTGDIINRFQELNGNLYIYFNEPFINSKTPLALAQTTFDTGANIQIKPALTDSGGRVVVRFFDETGVFKSVDTISDGIHFYIYMFGDNIEINI